MKQRLFCLLQRNFSRSSSFGQDNQLKQAAQRARNAVQSGETAPPPTPAPIMDNSWESFLQLNQLNPQMLPFMNMQPNQLMNPLEMHRKMEIGEEMNNINVVDNDLTPNASFNNTIDSVKENSTPVRPQKIKVRTPKTEKIVKTEPKDNSGKKKLESLLGKTLFLARNQKFIKKQKIEKMQNHIWGIT